MTFVVIKTAAYIHFAGSGSTPNITKYDLVDIYLILHLLLYCHQSILQFYVCPNHPNFNFVFNY